MKNFLFFIAFIALIISSGLLIHNTIALDLSKYEPILLGISITTGIFAINFSFYQYQASPYKELRRELSSVHITLALFVFILSITPLLVLAFATKYVAPIAIGIIPIIGVFGFILLFTAKREINPIVITDRMVSKKRVNKYLNNFSYEIENKLKKIDELKATDSTGTPTHEWGWYIPPDPSPNSPFLAIENTNLLVIRNRDIALFAELYERALHLVETVYNYSPKTIAKDNYKVKDVLTSEGSSFFTRICVDTLRDDVSCAFAKVIIDKNSNYLINKTPTFEQTDKLSFLLLSMTLKSSLKCFDHEQKNLSLSIITLARQLVSNGLKFEERENDSDFNMQFEHSLPRLTYPISELGRYAIKDGDSDFLYRCLDAYAWLGCEAVKNRNYSVTLECLRSLVQLGREAREKKLECFWDNCALTPWDHVEERIGWIFTWVAKIPKEKREMWLSSIEEAYQRLSGFEVSINIKNVDNENHLEIVKSDKKYTRTYWDKGQERIIDYSDFSFLKEMRMY